MFIRNLNKTEKANPPQVDLFRRTLTFSYIIFKQDKFNKYKSKKQIKLKKIIIIFFLLVNSSAFSQFTGGSGDGYSSGTSARDIILNTYYIAPLSEIVYCKCQPITVAFVPNFVAPVGTIFTVEMSDVNGNFTTPVVLGTSSNLSGDTVHGVIPTNIISGDKYKIRIASSVTTILISIPYQIALIL